MLALLALVVYGRQRWRDFFLLVTYGAGMILIATLIEGNVGTIYRHRAMLLPAAFVLAGLGLVWLGDARRQRRSRTSPEGGGTVERRTESSRNAASAEAAS